MEVSLVDPVQMIKLRQLCCEGSFLSGILLAVAPERKG